MTTTMCDRYRSKMQQTTSKKKHRYISGGKKPAIERARSKEGSSYTYNQYTPVDEQYNYNYSDSDRQKHNLIQLCRLIQFFLQPLIVAGRIDQIITKNRKERRGKDTWTRSNTIQSQPKRQKLNMNSTCLR